MKPTRHFKVCKCCSKAFYPVLSDEEFLYLFNDAEKVERAEFLKEEYEYAMPLYHPTQVLCEKCSLDPDVIPQQTYGRGLKFIKRTPPATVVNVVLKKKRAPRKKKDDTSTR